MPQKVFRLNIKERFFIVLVEISAKLREADKTNLLIKISKQSKTRR
jgi:hypothetical protein